MGFLDDLRRLATATAEVLRNPGAIKREFTLLTQADCANYYALLGDDVIELENGGFAEDDKPLWLNMGYWKHATSYPEACAALARMLADAAKLEAGGVMLDAGFGYGEQDLLWMDEYKLSRIIGVNVTPLHVEVANKRIAARGLQDRIDLRLASATDIPCDDASVDHVVALESAFHFPTREDFFREAMRILKPGGTIGCADMLPMPGTRPAGVVHWLGLRRWGYPLENAYDRDTYRDKMMEHGFVDVEVNSIRNHVYPGINHYRDARQAGASMADVVVELTAEDVESCFGIDDWQNNTGISDYVVFGARKPESA